MKATLKEPKQKRSVSYIILQISSFAYTPYLAMRHNGHEDPIQTRFMGTFFIKSPSLFSLKIMQTKSYLNFNAKSHSNLLAIFSLKSDFTSIFLTLLDSKEIKVFENQRKSLIQHFEQSELRLHFDWTKVDRKCQN